MSLIDGIREKLNLEYMMRKMSMDNSKKEK